VLANGPEDDANLPDVPGRKYIETAMEEGSFMVYVVSLFEGNRVDRRRPNDAVTNPSRLSLTEVVETTGGGYFRAFPGGRAQYLKEATDGYLVQRLSAVVEELRSQYALGFVPRHRDGKVGKIEVRVNRPGVTVSARKSYRAPGNTP
jgi:hypothetical protein